MKRWMFNIVAAISLVLCLATVGLWGYSCWRAEMWYPSNSALAYEYECGFTSQGVWIYRNTEHSTAMPHYRLLDALGFQYERRVEEDGPNRSLPLDHRSLVVPFWFLAAGTAVLPAIWPRRWRHGAPSRRHDGTLHCPKCHYNLAADASGSCPECGTPILARLVRKPATKGRIFSPLAGVSLILCLATVGLWAQSCLHPTSYSGGSDEDGGVVLSRTWLGATGISERSLRVPGITYRQVDISGTSGGAAFVYDHLNVSHWLLFVLTAILPALWLGRYGRQRLRRRDDGMPHCAKCDYNLTGNVSGICPECGTAVPAGNRQEE